MVRYLNCSDYLVQLTMSHKVVKLQYITKVALFGIILSLSVRSTSRI